jgi:phage nucleotide-binding protein
MARTPTPQTLPHKPQRGTGPESPLALGLANVNFADDATLATHIDPEAATKGPLIPSPKGITIIRASDVPDAWGINILIYAFTGVGKTFLARTAADDPKTSTVLFIDAEGGSRTNSDRDDIHVLKPKTFKDITDTYEWLYDNKTQYRTVVLDSLHEIQALGMKDIMRVATNPGFPSIQDWGKSSEQMTRVVRAFRDLAHLHGMNIVFTAPAREDKDERTGLWLIRPALTPAATNGVCGAVDTVGYLSVDVKTGTRKLRIQPTATINAKHRQPPGEVPLPPFIDNPTLPGLAQALAQSMPASIAKGTP